MCCPLPPPTHTKTAGTVGFLTTLCCPRQMNSVALHPSSWHAVSFSVRRGREKLHYSCSAAQLLCMVHPELSDPPKRAKQTKAWPTAFPLYARRSE